MDILQHSKLRTRVILSVCLFAGLVLLAPGSIADAELPNSERTVIGERLSRIFGIEVDQIGTIRSGETIRGAIDMGGDVDVYRFTVQKDNFIRLSLAGRSVNGTMLFVHDSNGNVINETHPEQVWWVQHPFMDPRPEILEWWMPNASEFYVSVFNRISKDIGRYVLSLEVSEDITFLRPPYEPPQPLLGEEDVHGNDSSSAVAVSVGDQVAFSLSDNADVDWFKIDAVAEESYVVSVHGNGASVMLEALNGNQELLASTRGHRVDRSRVILDAVKSGEHYIKVSPFHGFGTYTLTIGYNSTGASDAVTEIDFGEIVEHNGLLKFNATVDEVYEIYFLDPAYKIRMALYTPEGIGFLKSRYNGAPPYYVEQSLFRWQAESSGHHYLQVFQDGAARYSINVIDNDYVDDHADNQTEATELTFGVPVNGKIATHGDADFFRIDIPEGQEIVIHVVSDPHPGYASIVEIIDFNGQSELVGRMSYQVRTLWRSKVAGPHWLKVQGDWDSEVDSVLGTYTIEVELLDATDEHGDYTDTATPIDIGTSIDGRLSCYGDRDVFRLRTDPRSAYRVRMHAQAGLEAAVYIYDASGRDPNRRGYMNQHEGRRFHTPFEWGPSYGHPKCEPLESESGYAEPHETEFQTWNGGDFHIHVAGNYSRDGDYSISVEPIDFDDYGNEKATAYDLQFGEKIDGTINIPGDYDVFRVTSELTQSAELHLELGSLENGCIYLMEMGSRDFKVEDEWCIHASSDPNALRNAKIVWTMPEIGEYYLIVSTPDDYAWGRYSRSTGSYSLSIRKIEISDDHGDARETSTSTNIGKPIRGRIDTSDDIDTFRFEAEEGDIIRANVIHDSLWSASVKLCDVGNCLGDLDSKLEGDAKTLRKVWRTSRDGSHYVSVSASTVGEYMLTLTRVDYEDDHSNNRNAATQLAIGGKVEGNLEVVGDVDRFKFDAELGKVYRLVLDPGTIDSRRVELLDSDGEVLHHFEDEFDWQAPQDGTFHIAVFVPRYRPNTGTYELTVFESPDDDHGYDFGSATKLEIGETVDATIAWKDDLDYFRFDASQGTQYRIFFEGGYFSFWYITLYDSDGSELAQEVHISEIIWTAPSDGTYYFVVEAWSIDGYRAGVHVSDYQDDYPDRYYDAASISVGESLDGVIGWRDEDWFRFDGEKGVTYHIDIERGTLFHSRAKIIYIVPPETYSQELAWDSIVVDDNTTRISFTPSQSGVYRIKLDASENRGWGSYTIRLATSS